MNEKDFNIIFSTNLLHFLKTNNMTQAELAERLEVSTATTSNWCNGIKLPRMDKIDKMCKIFNCLRSDLIEDKGNLRGVKQTKGVIINVYGSVAAGVPIEAIEDIVDTEEITQELARTGTFFGLRIKGDSMEPRMTTGDVVIVKKQDDAESGDVVIATVNGTDATCKRLMKYENGIALLSTNPDYDPMFFSNQEIEDKPVRIIGRVVELRAKF